jgi:hypothetical protein
MDVELHVYFYWPDENNDGMTGDNQNENGKKLIPTKCGLNVSMEKCTSMP